jgi:hypothetical protein
MFKQLYPQNLTYENAVKSNTVMHPGEHKQLQKAVL